jgi:hypothetical protein
MSHDTLHAMVRASPDSAAPRRGSATVHAMPETSEEPGTAAGIIKPLRKKPWAAPKVILSEISQDTAHGVGAAADGPGPGTSSLLNHS